MQRMLNAVVLFAALVTFTGFVAEVGGAEQIPAERRLPPDVIQFVSLRDVADLRKRFAESLLGRMFDDPEFWMYCDAATGIDTRMELHNRIKAGFLLPLERNAGMPAAKLLQFFQGESAFAVVRGGPGEMAMVVLINVGDQASEVSQYRECIVKLFIDGDARSIEQSIRGTPCTMFEDVDAGTKNKLTDRAGYFLKDSFLVLASSEKLLDTVLLRWGGKHPETLESDSDFRAIQTSCRAGLSHVDLVWHFKFDRKQDVSTVLLETAAALPFYFLVMTPLVYLGGTDMPEISYANDSGLSTIGGVLTVSGGEYDLVNRIGARSAVTGEKEEDRTLPAKASPKAISAGMVDSPTSAPPSWVRSDVAQLWEWRFDPDQVTKQKRSIEPSDRTKMSLLAECQSLLKLLAHSESVRVSTTWGARIKQSILKLLPRRLTNEGLKSLSGVTRFVELRSQAGGNDAEGTPNGVLALEIKDDAVLRNAIARLEMQNVLTPHQGASVPRDLWEVKLPLPTNRVVIYSSEDFQAIDERWEAANERIGADEPADKYPETRTCFLAIAHRSLFLAERLEPIERVAGEISAGTELAVTDDFRAIAALGPKTCLFSQYRRFSSSDLLSRVEALQANFVKAGSMRSKQVVDPKLTDAVLKYFPPVAGFAEADSGGIRTTVFRLRPQK